MTKFNLFLLGLSISLLSCEKCKDCVVTKTETLTRVYAFNTDEFPLVSTDTVTYCNEELDEYEPVRNYNGTAQGLEVRIEEVTNCPE